MNHFLNLDISDTLSAATLRISDGSSYLQGFPIENNILEITPPHKDCPIIFNVVEGFNMVFTANNLELAPSNNTQLVYLQDGLYKIKYSINPNTSTHVEKNWFRMSRLNSLYRNKVQSLFLNREKLTNSVFKAKQENLLNIGFKIDASKYFAEEECDFKKASTLYNEANTELKHLNDCLTC
jgi:hypothetical protein